MNPLSSKALKGVEKSKYDMKRKISIYPDIFFVFFLNYKYKKEPDCSGSSNVPECWGRRQAQHNPMLLSCSVSWNDYSHGNYYVIK